MSRDAPPPLPGGYKVGEKVFYTAANYTYPSGDKLVHGQQCEVTGPCTFDGTGSRVKATGKGVSVLFPGNKGNVGCLLTEVRAASAATPPPARAITHGRGAVRCEGWVRAGKCG